MLRVEGAPEAEWHKIETSPSESRRAIIRESCDQSFEHSRKLPRGRGGRIQQEAQKYLLTGSRVEFGEYQMTMGSNAEIAVENSTGDDEEMQMKSEEEEKTEAAAPSTSASEEELMGEDIQLGTGHIVAFLLSGLLGIGLMLGAVVSCTFLTVAPGGLLISDDGAEVYRLGLFWSDASSYRPTFDEDLQKNVWSVRTERDGCQPYGQGGGAEGYALYAPQQAARAFAILSVGMATLLMMYHSCHLADLDGEGRRLYRPVLSSALFFLAGTAALLSLLFLEHTWCDEKFYGTCEMGWAAVLAIFGAISLFACSGICWRISHLLVRSGKK